MATLTPPRHFNPRGATIAIVKLAHSRKSVHFIDDQGNVFFTAVKGLNWMIPTQCPSCAHEFGGTWAKPIVLKRFPNKVPEDKFQVSEVWDPTTGGSIKTENAYDAKFMKARAEAAAYTDRVIE